MSRKAFMKFKAVVRHGGEGSRVVVSGYLGPQEFSAGLGSQPVPVSIFRKEIADFRFNDHYREYFDGLDRSGAGEIFSGELPAINRRKVEFADPAPPGRTYAYWIGLSGAETPPTGPAVVRVRDPRVWWPYHDVRRRLEELAERHPHFVSLESCGMTVRGRDIPMLRVGNRQRCIALIGALHAGESGPELLIPAVEQLLSEDESLLKRVGVLLLPEVNIDERERQVEGEPEYLRTNANGVDLNRNFPAGWEEIDESYGLISSDPDAVTYRGSAPASERETRAVISLIRAARPAAIFTTHCLAGICSPVFLTARNAADDPAYHAECLRWLAPYTQGYYNDPGRPVVLKYACSAGSLPRWAYENGQIPAFDLEWDGDDATRPCLHDGTTPGMIARCAQQHYRGLRQLLEIAAAG